MGATKLLTAGGGGVTLDAASTATDKTITVPADNGTLIYANSSGNVGIGATPTGFPSGGTLTLPADKAITSAGNGFTLGNNWYYNSGDKFAGTGYATQYYQYSGTHRWYVSSASGSAGGAVTFNEAMRIDSSGNLLVGTTSQYGSGKVCIPVTGGSTWGIAIENTNTSTATNIIFRNSSQTTVGTIQSTTTATSYNTSSDYRLKENIAPMTGALSVVQQLKPCTYNWKSDGSDGQGFIAHELQAVVPDCVTGEKDAVDAEGNPVYQGIDTSFLVATLTAAIQELKAELDAVKAQLENK